jgi:RNA polymerase sigma-70 factor (ECF subfamily)
MVGVAVTDRRGSTDTAADAVSAAVFVEANQAQLRRVVHRVAARYRLPHHDRDDLFQEVVARLCAAFEQINDRAAAFAVVETTAKRLIIDAFRYAEVRDQGWLGLVHRHHSSVPADPADAVVQRAQVHHVHRAVRGLPDGQRRAVVLADMAELSAADGAAVMQITTPAFKSLLQRGRSRLRVELREAPAVLPALRRWRPRLAPIRTAATSLVGAAAWCALLIHPAVTPLPQRQPAAVAPYAALSEPSLPTRLAAIRRPDVQQAHTHPPVARARHADHPARGRSVVPTTPRLCVGPTCFGTAKNGDELCLTTGQGDPLSCTKESQVAVCEYTPATPYATCTRHGDPDWIVPPP